MAKVEMSHTNPHEEHVDRILAEEYNAFQRWQNAEKERDKSFEDNEKYRDSLVNEKLSSVNSALQAQDKKIIEIEQNMNLRIDSINPTIVNGDVTNNADEEDIHATSDGKLQFKDRVPVGGMGYVVLRKKKSFASQVTSQNTIYEIRYNFDLGGSTVSIPTGCTLKFNGGSITNGTLCCSGSLLLEGDVSLPTLSFVSYLLNTYVKSSWFSGDFASNLQAVMNSSSNTEFITDSDINLSSYSSVTCNKLILNGNGFSISNPPSFTVKGDILVSNIRFINCSSNLFVTSSSYEESANVSFIDVFASASGAESFYHNASGNQTSQISGQSIRLCCRNCNISNFKYYGLYLKCAVHDSIIDNNYFTGLGSTSTLHGISAVMVGLDLNQAGGGSYTCTNVTISNNKVDKIVGVYTSEGDRREIHDFLLYGYNCRICNNTCLGLSASTSSTTDLGQDAESIYIKGNYCSIISNYIIDGAGASSDGSITLKGSNVDNVVQGNYVSNTIGKCFLSHINGSCIVKDNSFFNSGSTFVAYSSSPNSYFVNNVFSCSNKSFLNRSGVYLDGHNITFEGNTIQNFIPCLHVADAVTTSNPRQADISRNTIIVDVPSSVSYSSWSIKNVLRLENWDSTDSVSHVTNCYSNTIRINGAQEPPLFFKNVNFSRNDVNVTNSSSNALDYTILAWKSSIIDNNNFELDNSSVPLTRSQSSNTIYVRNNIFTKSLPSVINGGTVSGNSISFNFYGSDRPSNPLTGMLFFDTTLGKPIYWQGTKWVDATGADV